MLSRIASSCPPIFTISSSVSPNRARFATWRTCSSDIMPGLRSFACRISTYLSAVPASLRAPHPSSEATTVARAGQRGCKCTGAHRYLPDGRLTHPGAESMADQRLYTRERAHEVTGCRKTTRHDRETPLRRRKQGDDDPRGSKRIRPHRSRGRAGIPTHRELRDHRRPAHHGPGGDERFYRLAVPAAPRLPKRLRGHPRQREGRTVQGLTSRGRSHHQTTLLARHQRARHALLHPRRSR